MSKVLLNVSVRSLFYTALLLVAIIFTTNFATAAGNLKIHSFNGPSELKVGEDGVWKVSASDSESITPVSRTSEDPTDTNNDNGKNNDSKITLSYKVEWGDESMAKKAAEGLVSMFRKDNGFEQKTTFTHSYKKAGDYTIKVTVKDRDGATDKSTATVKVGEEEIVDTTFKANETSGKSPFEVTFKVNLGTRNQARIDFGDGSDVAVVKCDQPVTENQYDTCDNPVEVKHTYASEGSYKAVLFKIYDQERVVKDTIKIRVKSGNALMDFFHTVADAFQGAFDTAVDNLFPGISDAITEREFANLPDINTDEYQSGTRSADEIEAIIINDNPTGLVECNFVPGPKKFQAYIITTTNEIGISDCASEDAYGYLDSIITNLMMRHGFTGLHLDLLKDIPTYIGATGDNLLEVQGENEEGDPVEDVNRIGFEVKVKDKNGATVQNWIQGNVTIHSDDILAFRWDAREGYKQCLPFLSDNGSYAFTRDDSKMLTANTENEGFNIYEHTASYYVECERTSENANVHTSVIEVKVDDNSDRTVEPPTKDQYSLVKDTESMKVTVNRQAPAGCTNDVKYVGEIDWGDGSVTKQLNATSQECVEAKTISESHTYKKAGTYRVVVKLNGVNVFRKEITVREGSGNNNGNDSVKLNVSSNNPLKVSLTTNDDAVNKKIEGCVYSLGFYGQSGNGLSVDWGDGSSEPGDSFSEAVREKDCTNVVSSHTYSKAGSYTVTVHSWHPGPTDAPIIDWKNSATVKVGGNGNTDTDDSVRFNASPKSGQAPLKVTFTLPTNINSTLSFGDKSKARSFSICKPSEPNQAGGGANCLASREVIHTYEKAGTYTARLITGCPVQGGRCAVQATVHNITIEVK